jgi:S1-C subfamily serine protease
MPDAPRGAVIAIGAAIVALLTSLAAVIVVVSRSADATPARAASASATSVSERRVPADDVAKLKRDTVENVTDKGKVIGVKVTDDKLRSSLGLAPDDVITAIAGRAIKREFDVYDAVLGMSMMDSSVVYVDLVHDGKPQLVRWQLDGDLRSARRATDIIPPAPVPIPPPPSPPSTDPLNPYSPDPSDPVDSALLDTIRKLDDSHYEVPRTTVDRVLQNPMAMAKGVRVVPAMRNGKPEGMKLYAIRPTSLWAALGFRNGDTIRAINGVELTSPDKALDAYTTLRDATRFEIDLLRRGAPEVLVITIR